MKKVGSKVIKRFIAAASIFFVPLIIGVVLNIPAIKNSLNLVDDPLCEDGDFRTEDEIRADNEKSRVKLNMINLYLFEGEKGTIQVTSSNKDVSWASSDEKVATVDKKGKVTAKKKGTARISATSGNNKATCIVTVRTKVDSNSNNGNNNGNNGTVITYAHFNKYPSGINSETNDTCPKKPDGSAPCPSRNVSQKWDKVVATKQVKKGELIGYVGDTCNSLNTHLHVEIVNTDGYCYTDPWKEFGNR